MCAEDLRTRLFDDAAQTAIMKLLGSSDDWVRDSVVKLLLVAVNHGKLVIFHRGACSHACRGPPSKTI